jgi:hypothetical protein
MSSAWRTEAFRTTAMRLQAWACCVVVDDGRRDAGNAALDDVMMWLRR